MDSPQPIGLFDSGVGGITVLQAIQRLLPQEALLFVADQAHVPYGARPLQEVQSFSEGVVRYLLDQKSKLIVVACNTASAAALSYLREKFRGVPFVGMEPAVKPAVEQTQSGVVGVLATQATFQGTLYASVVARFGKGVKVLQDTCAGLVSQIEAGALHSAETRAILENALHPMLAQGIDAVVLGCTHYPFVTPIIQEIAGPGVRIIDPAPAVARQTQRLLDQYHLHNPDGTLHPPIRFLTTGNPENLRQVIEVLPLDSALRNSLTISSLSWQETANMARELHGKA